MASNSKKVICENGCAKATRVAKKFDPFRSTPKSIVTIDFGTTHCSVSSLLDVNACPDPSVLDPVLLNLDTKCRKRVPSCILFDKFGDRKGIGYEAREEYATLGMRVRPAYAFFEHVKKEIQRKEDVDRNHKIQAMNGKQYFLIDVIAHILCHLKEMILEEIKDDGFHSIEDVDWVVTVPAIWKARGKRMMREAGYMAGLCDPHVKMGNLEEATGRVQPPPKEESNPEKLSLALEPESAAIWCKKKIDTAQRNDVETYLVVDCGGGTVDIATHGISNGHVQELAPSAGNMSGGTTINETFRHFLSCFIGDPGFTRYFSVPDPVKRSKRVSDINKIVYTAFEEQKIIFGNQERKDSFVVEFTYAFIQDFGKLMEGKAESLNHTNVQIEEDGSKMRLSRSKMVEFFKPTIDDISKLICDHIRAKGLAPTLDKIFWIGGFGGCRYLRSQLQEAINNQFHTELKREYACSCPTEPQLAIVKGALAFRCDPSVIQKRKADATYGIACSMPFVKGKHRPDYSVDDEDNRSKKWCKNIFSTFIERDESICTNEVFVTNYVPLSKSQKTMTLTFYSALHPNVWYTTDRGVNQLAKMVVNIAGYGRDRDVEVVFDVTHTEIQVCVRDKLSQNEYKIVIDFLFSEL